MNLQNAVALWWLMPLAGIVIALYLLRMRRRDVLVPARFLWPERTDEVRANALFQRLRFNWLLVLQLIALALIVLSLARPQSLQKGLAGKVTVIVIDASASMGATDVHPTRFDHAVSLAKGIVESATTNDQVMLIEAGPVPRVVFPLSNDSTAHLRAIKSVRRTDAAADIGEALRLAATRVGEIDGAKIVLLSDGSFPAIDDFSSGKASLVYQTIGEQARNVAIESLGTNEGATGRVGYCSVKNYGLDPADATLSLYADGELIDSQKSTIASKGSWGKDFMVPRDTKVVEARIETGDFLGADDYAVAIVDPGTNIRVLLVTNGDPFLESALALDPRVTLDKATKLPNTETKGSPGSSQYDVVVFEGVTEQDVKASGVLAFGVAGPASPVTAKDRIESFEFLDAADHPLLKGVDFSQTYIENVQKIEPKPIGRVLVEGRGGPLVVSAQTEKKQIFVAFSPLDSDFPLTVSFPIFIANALDYLTEKSTSNAFAVRAGQQFQIPAKTQEPATLSIEGGDDMSIEPLQGRYIVRGVDLVGKYLLEAGGDAKSVYADLRDPTESAIDPQQFVSVTGKKLASVQNLRRYADFWRPLVFFALLVLAGEWWLYARRS